MTEPDAALPRPGLLGRLVRLGMAVFIGYLGYSAIVDTPSFWDGYTRPLGSLGWVVPLTLFSSWVVNELFQKDWGWWPSAALLGGAGAVVGLGALGGDPFGPAYGIYLWSWAVLFSFVLAPAHLLAVFLGTPGCEMRSYAHLWTKLRGGDASTVACPGWIDRLDGVRVMGRW